jgi:hypothetical protein
MILFEAFIEKISEYKSELKLIQRVLLVSSSGYCVAIALTFSYLWLISGDPYVSLSVVNKLIPRGLDISFGISFVLVFILRFSPYWGNHDR